jgi:adenosylcobinamide-GDP ribazoletransferase
VSSGQADTHAATRADDRGRSARRTLGGVFGALAFLTILPLPTWPTGAVAPDLNVAVPWFPVIGAAVGAAAGGIRAGFDPLLGQGPSTVLAMIVMVAVTGALHYDGLADTADGLGVRGDLARRLAVMRDSAIGAFGVLALLGWALLLFAALEPLTSAQALKTLIAAGAASRLALLIQGFGARPARADGLGAGFDVALIALVVAAIVTAAITLAAAGLWRGAVSLGAGAIAAMLVTLFVRRTFGGRTGDTLGAGAVITELAVCLALVASWH